MMLMKTYDSESAKAMLRGLFGLEVEKMIRLDINDLLNHDTDIFLSFCRMHSQLR